MGKNIKIEQRWCDVCERLTDHVVTELTQGAGEVVANPGECWWHRRWVSGRIDFRDPQTLEFPD